MNFILQTFVVKLLQEAFLSLVGKLPWAAITERLLSRVIVAGLRKLASMTTNTLDDQTVEDIIKSIETPSLPELK